MLPFSNVWRHVSAKTQDADLRGDRPRLPVDRAAVVGAGQREGVQLHHRHRVVAVLLRLHPADHRTAHRRAAGGRSRRPSPAPSTSAGGGCRYTSPHWWCSSAVAVALLFLPQFTSNKWVFLGVRRGRRGVVGHRSAVAVAAAAMPGRTTPRPTWNLIPCLLRLLHMTTRTAVSRERPSEDLGPATSSPSNRVPSARTPHPAR